MDGSDLLVIEFLRFAFLVVTVLIMHSVKFEPLVIFPDAQSNLGLTTTAVGREVPERTYHFLGSGIPI